jgi:hypothetical protein
LNSEHASAVVGAPERAGTTELPLYPRKSLDVEEKGSFAEDGEEPTEEELFRLRHVGDKIPMSAWLVAVVELAERFTYYGITGPFQNYIQNERGGLRPGALDMGQSSATALQYFFQFCKLIFYQIGLYWFGG